MKRIYIQKTEKKNAAQQATVVLLAFLFGCFFSATTIFNIRVDSLLLVDSHPSLKTALSCSDGCPKSYVKPETRDLENTSSSSNILNNLRILVAIVAFDFSQVPHLEELLGGYHDLCMAGSNVSVVIHSTVAYPVTLIDLWNSRLPCPNFDVEIVLKPKSLRLHLVDCHRQLFYDRIDDYDLFIYTEDDIKLSPTVVGTYMEETRLLAETLKDHPTKKASDFNVGIVRYEYNYPANVIIDDKTRHATQNVTRVYWEHSGFERPVIPNCITTAVENDDTLSSKYFTMKNHHQGMYLATRDLLLAWKDRCDFHIASNRPGRGSQPTEGTQRVWMSSQMLYGGRHCGVLQVLPKERSFGALTVWHLPNKNYRRVGKYRNRVFSDGTEVFDQPHESLLTAMELHLAMRKEWPPQQQIPYRGIRMTNEKNGQDKSPMQHRRLMDYQRYAERGGVLHSDDFKHVDLIEES